MNANSITIYVYAASSGVRVVRGVHSVSADSGIPTDIRSYSSWQSAYAAERGGVRNILAMMFRL